MYIHIYIYINNIDVKCLQNVAMGKVTFHNSDEKIILNLIQSEHGQNFIKGHGTQK